MAEEGQLTAMEKVVRSPEVLDYIHSLLDLNSLLKVRSVCRKWREVSDLSLKRRMRLVDASKTLPWEACKSRHTYYRSVESSGVIGKEVALKIQKYEKRKSGLFEDGVVAPPLQDMHLIIGDPTGPCEYKLNGVCTAPAKARPAPSFLATVLKFDWLPAVTILVLDKCLALEDWNSVGLHILQGFPSVGDLTLKLVSVEKKDVGSPLCYTELKMGERSGLAPEKFETLEKLVFYCEEMTEIEDAGFDIVERAPNLKRFDIEYSLSRDNLRLSASLDTMHGLLFLGKSGLAYSKPFNADEKHQDCDCRESLSKTWQDDTVRFIDSVFRVLKEAALASVTCVKLNQCITAADWALVGVHILQKFPAVEEVWVLLDSLPSSRKEFWESFMHRYANHCAEPKISSVKKISIMYTACKWEILGKNHCKPCGVCYDVLKLCPNLKVFTAFVRWGAYSLYFGYGVRANRQGTPATWALELDMWIDRQHGSKFKTPVFGDVAEIFKALGPKKLVSNTGLDFACAIDSTALSTVETLTVENWFLIPGQIGLPLKGANVGPAFQNLKKLTWAGSDPQHCIAICQLRIAEGFSKGLAFEHVRTLDMVHGLTKLIGMEWEHVMRQIHPHIHEIVPNLQVLVVGFVSDTAEFIADHPYRLTNTLKLVKSFGNKLKHLVLVSKYCVSNCKSIEPEEFGCFAGLLSVTVILRKPQFLESYTVIFAKICSKVPSIRKLGVYSEQGQNEGQPMPLDLAILEESDIELPEHLTVETGSRNLLQGKAVFEEVEDSYIMWKDVKYSKMMEPQNEEAQGLARLQRGDIDSDSDSDDSEEDFDERDQAVQ